jgi:hypothetical protein
MKKDLSLKYWYLFEYPTDELGLEINSNSTFVGLLHTLYEGGDVYDYFGVSDSLVRERLFDGLAKHINTSYDYVYNLWLN